MMICVTNRKLCRGDFLERIRQLAAGGADVILLREKDLSPAAYTELAEKCLAICREYSTALWLNSFTGTAAALQLPVQLPLSVLQELTDADKEKLPAFGAIGSQSGRCAAGRKAVRRLADRRAYFSHILQAGSAAERDGFSAGNLQSRFRSGVCHRRHHTSATGRGAAGWGIRLLCHVADDAVSGCIRRISELETYDLKERSVKNPLLIDTIQRYLLFIIGLFFSALGVAITKKGELGVSPISSVANVMSIRLPQLSLGYWLIIWNCVLILGQILLLRRKFQWIQLLQVPLSFLFGWFTDFGVWLISFFTPKHYIVQILLVLVGTIVLGFGITLAVIANVILNSGEAFVKALSDTIHKEFGNVKIVFDISCVVVAVILSFLFFHKLVGTREGTIIAAFCTGFVVKFFSKFITAPLERFLKKNIGE